MITFLFVARLVIGAVLLACAIRYLVLPLSARSSRPRRPPGPPAATHPRACLFFGTLIGALASWAALILVGGFLLPGLDLIARNDFSTYQIWIPPGQHSTRGPSMVHPEDTDLIVFMLSFVTAISFVGAYLISLGLRARRSKST